MFVDDALVIIIDLTQMQIRGFLSKGVEGVVLPSSRAQLWRWRGHHL